MPIENHIEKISPKAQAAANAGRAVNKYMKQNPDDAIRAFVQARKFDAVEKTPFFTAVIEQLCEWAGVSFEDLASDDDRMKQTINTTRAYFYAGPDRKAGKGARSKGVIPYLTEVFFNQFPDENGEKTVSEFDRIEQVAAKTRHSIEILSDQDGEAYQNLLATLEQQGTDGKTAERTLINKRMTLQEKYDAMTPKIQQLQNRASMLSILHTGCYWEPARDSKDQTRSFVDKVMSDSLGQDGGDDLDALLDMI